jgi:hypothetical protein
MRLFAYLPLSHHYALRGNAAMYLAELHEDLPSGDRNTSRGEIMHDLVNDIVGSWIHQAGRHDLQRVNGAAFGKPSCAPAQRPISMSRRPIKRSSVWFSNRTARPRSASAPAFDIFSSFCIEPSHHNHRASKHVERRPRIVDPHMFRSGSCSGTRPKPPAVMSFGMSFLILSGYLGQLGSKA